MKPRTILFKDEKENLYYMNQDWLMVDLVALRKSRKIGKVTMNLQTNKANLIVHRRSDQRWRFGHLISAAPFENMDFNRLTLIEDNSRIFVLDWDSVKDIWRQWSFTPHNGMERQIIIPQNIWSEVKQHV